ncbi:ribonuclease H-like domain-containing protein [Tanacetum coccineum]
MVTRAQVGTVKPNPRFQGHVSHISPLPKSPSIALFDPNWRDVMYDEYNALIKNSTWILVPKPPNVNVVRSMWLFQHKYHADGSLSRYKARLVANGPSQQFGVDCDETFSLVVKPATIRTPPGFVDARFPQHVCRLQSPLYGLKQAPRAWHGSEVAYLLIYVDDIVLTASSTNLLQRIISSLHKEFDMTDLGVLNYFLGISVTRGLHLVIVFLGDNLLSWSAKRKHTLSRSSAETEYRGVANVVAETAWLRNLLRELHTPLLFATLVYCDNVSAIYMTANPVPHQRTKHIEIDIHFVRDMVARGQVRVPSRYQYADIFTKGLPSALFEEFRSSEVMASPIISISSDLSEESVGSHYPQVILFGTIPAIIPVIPEVPIAPADPIVASEVGAVFVISPTGVLDLVDYSSSSDSDPSEDSLPIARELPLVSPFLCTDDSEADSESEPAEQIPERHESLTPSSEFPLAPVVGPPGIRRRPAILVRPGEAIPFDRAYRTYPNGPHFTSDPSSSSSSLDSLSDSSSLHSSGQSHSGPLTRVASPRLVDPPSGRFPTTLVPSSTPISRLIAPALADLSPRKRFRDSYSSEVSGEEHMEMGTTDVETVEN